MHMIFLILTDIFSMHHILSVVLLTHDVILAQVRRESLNSDPLLVVLMVEVLLTLI